MSVKRQSSDDVREVEHWLLNDNEASSGEEEEEDVSTLVSTAQETDSGSDVAVTDRQMPVGPKPCFSAKCCCHVCYVCQFLLYLLVFPLWAKWLVTSPIPLKYRHASFPAFPLIRDLVRNEWAVERGMSPDPGSHEILLSPVPNSPSSCNFACGGGGFGQDSQMNFQVSLTLNDTYLPRVQAHTIYPVLLASVDFQSWWVVSDKRDSHPQAFFASRSFAEGKVFQHTTEQCIAPPASKQAYTGGATYLLACITWHSTAAAELAARFEQHEESNPAAGIDSTDLGTLCDAVGGVCGWPCGSDLNSALLPGCAEDGTIQVNKTALAGEVLPGASFNGLVMARECQDGSGDGDSCVTSMQPFAKWTCHHCHQPSPEGSDARRRMTVLDEQPPEAAEGGTVYASFPRFMVELHGVELPAGMEVLGAPRAFLLRGSPGSDGRPPASWRQLYGSSAHRAAPLPVKPGAVVEDRPPQPVLTAATRHAMQLVHHNRVTMKSSRCFAPRGPLYLVACAVNQSLYDDGFQFVPGQQVAPPPFNDRCLALAGRCGLACMMDQAEQGLDHCHGDGYINTTELIGPIRDPKNRTLPVWLFVYTLLIGFSVKVVMLCPGLFRPYPFRRGYEPELTEQLRYIATCTCSSGENKCTVLRNLIGVISCMPRDCHCRYHVVFSDEGHRLDQRVMWQRLCGLLEAVPDFGGSSYEENVMQFFQMWTDMTKKLDLHQLDDSGPKVIEQSIMDRISGKAVIRKLRSEVGWDCSKDDEQAFIALETACSALEMSLRHKRSTKVNLHRDDCHDWAPADPALKLHLHYLARAKPIEDERTVPAQHVAPGTWFYKVPPDAEIKDWLALRAQACEYVYAIDGQAEMDFNVPLRTSRGKAGGLNFAENYLTVFAERVENLYGDDKDEAPCLFSICDARHQFQQDFFHTTLPYFYTEDGELDPNVAFTQCPQHFHEMQDKLDYLDNNNAAFFRLNCMIRNCCGGVSSCGTNGTWMIKHRDNSTVWEAETRRVRDPDRRKRAHVVERRVFHESCKVEDTASSLQAVLLGRRSQFINRRLSYGMAKDPENYLAAVQRWAEGGVVLNLQTFFGCQQGMYMVWLISFAFVLFVASLFRLVSSDTWLVVDFGLVDQASVDGYTSPVVNKTADFVLSFLHGTYMMSLTGADVKDYVHMCLEFAVWVLELSLCLLVLWAITAIAKCFRRRHCLFPDEMRWWARLLISMDNLTYFFWFWTSFFWIGFNYYSVFARKGYHFQGGGMFAFMLLVNGLHWGMTISSALRYQLEESMESNEVIFLTLDNVWRSTQLFYITAPLLAYSIIEGVRDYMRYQFYGEDISFWSGGDRGAASKELVKYWTLLLIVGSVVAWVFYFAFGGHNQTGSLAACLIVTIIALDVLHPCVYLWVGNSKLSREEAQKMTWCQALTSSRWWARRLYAFVLNPVMTGILRWGNPLWQLSMPLICLWLPYVGVSQAFTTLGTNTLR